jgi:hypothetical protein
MRIQLIAIAAIAVIACMGLASASPAQPTGEFATFSNCPLLHQGTQTASQSTVDTGCYMGTQAQPTKWLRATGQIALFVMALGGVPLIKGNEIKVRSKDTFKKRLNKPIRLISKTLSEKWFALLRPKNLKILRLGGSSHAYALYHHCRAGDQC